MREALAAFVALVGLLARVQSRMFDQVVLVFECFLADLTLVWSFTCRDGDINNRRNGGLVQNSQLCANKSCKLQGNQKYQVLM